MHFRHEESRHLLRNASASTAVESKFDHHSIVWPFLIQNAMENPLCTTATPANSTVSVLLWTTIAVFGIVYTLL
ncbi:hypothetical protein pipiens_013272, partial [Culex pipiens pipiens]